MNRNIAFSLAEALITLLIVCIITIVSAPMITKKAKNPMRANVWQKDAYAQSAVSVRNGYDVRFGSDSKKTNQSIVVVGTLYFKDRNGNVIGWIAEDGSSSFGGGAGGIDSRKIDTLIEMLNRLSSMVQSGKLSDNGSQYRIASSDSESSARRPYAKKIQPRKIQTPRGPNVPSKLGGSSSNESQGSLDGIDTSQLQNKSPEELQQILNQLMQMAPN